MKTIQITGPALDLARKLNEVILAGEAQAQKLREDLAATEAATQKQAGAMMKEILGLMGIDNATHVGSVDATYLKDHGVAFIQMQERESFPSILERIAGNLNARAEDLQ